MAHGSLKPGPDHIIQVTCPSAAMSLHSLHHPLPQPPLLKGKGLFISLPPELVLEIISSALEPSKSDKKEQPTTNSFSSRIKILAILSSTHSSLRSLIFSTPVFWSQVEINVIQDLSCSPPLAVLEELFERSQEMKISIRVVHWGEERIDQDYTGGGGKAWEWVPGATREVRKVLERHEKRIERLRFEFHDLNGTEYTMRQAEMEARKQDQGRWSWASLKHLEMYASDWTLVHSMPMGWVESMLMTASPENIVIQGNGAFGWPILGREMSCIRKLRVETEITERLALEIMSRTSAPEECVFERMIRVSTSSPRSQSREGDIVVPVLSGRSQVPLT